VSDSWGTRRELLGRGVLAIGTAAGLAFGSGAFTQTEADRPYDLAIAADDSALLSLEPSGVNSQIVSTTDDGILQFDLTDTGLSTQATSTIGMFQSVDFDDPEVFQKEAFVIVNNTVAEIAVTINVDVEDGDANVKFVVSGDDPTGGDSVKVPNDTESTTDTDEDGATIELGSTERLYGGVIIETTGTTDITADLSVSAERIGGGES